MKEKIIPFDPDTYTASQADIGAMRSWVDIILRATKLKPPFKVIEFGTGSGKFSACFVSIGCDVLATDANPGMVGRAESNFPKTFKTRVVVLPDLPTELKGQHDLAFNEGLIEHYERDERIEVLNAMVASLKHGGWLAVYVPLEQGEMDEHIYSTDEIYGEFEEAGLEEISVYNIGWRNNQGVEKQHLGCAGRKVRR